MMVAVGSEWPDEDAPVIIGPTDGETDGTWYTIGHYPTEADEPQHFPAGEYRIYWRADSFAEWPHPGRLQRLRRWLRSLRRPHGP